MDIENMEMRLEPDFPKFILQHLPVGLLTVDSHLRITYFNPAAANITGWTPEEAFGKTCGDVLKGGRCEQGCPLKTVLTRRRDSTTIETTIRNKNGRIIPVRLRTAAMFDSDGRLLGALEAFSDISDLKKYEEERSQTLSLFAHDMKTPLISIDGFVKRLLENKTGELNDKQRKYLKVIKNEIDQIKSLALDFLDVARLGYEGAALAWSKVSLEDVISNAASEYESKAETLGMKLIAEIESNVPEIKGDSHRLRRAVTNLLDNALKYSGKGEVKISLHRGGLDFAEIKVMDNGPGLAPDEMESIFGSFQRGSASSGKEGTGLGLTAVKKIAEAHYGSVTACNRAEGGAEFTIILPLQNT